MYFADINSTQYQLQLYIMRKWIPQVPILFAFLCLTSCTSEPLDVEITEIFGEIQNEDSSGNDSENGEDDSANDTTQPCDIDLSNLPANTTISINCILDLNGETINLATGINFDFENGKIENGTLNFSGGYIAGELMNKTLTIKGDVNLKSEVFEFNPEKWDIVQGDTDFETALQNRINLENLIRQTAKMNASTFKIDAFDAYFEVTEVKDSSNQNFYPWVEAINIPNDYSLVMTNNSHLRVYPNSSPKYSLLAVYNTSNSNVTGGTLHGDRDEHTYAGSSSHEWGHLITLHGADNAKISGVTMKNGSGDGMKIEDDKFSFSPNHVPSKNVIVDACIFDNNRRNNLSITAGQNIIVENSTFLNAGRNTAKSNGTDPRMGIDIEAYRKRENGTIVYYEKVDGVIIRNNEEKNSVNTGFLIYIGDNVTIENNKTETGIGYKYTSGSTIKNNILIAAPNSKGTGIKAGTGDTETIFNNQVYGNTIKGYKTGITVYSQNHQIHDNIIEDFDTGIFLKNTIDSKIYKNTFSSNRPGSRGIFIHATYINNVDFLDNIITTIGNPFKFAAVNNGNKFETYKLTLTGNEFNSNSKGDINKVSGLLMRENKINTSTEIYDSKNFDIENNLIKAGNKHGIFLRNRNKNIAIVQNTINVNSGKDCVKIEASTNLNDIVRDSNICVD
mgnify:CR=1 FL=1